MPIPATLASSFALARAGAESGDVDGAAFFFGVGVGATIDGKAEAPLLSSAIVAAFVGVARGVGLVAAGFVAAGFAWSEGKADCECATGAHKIAAAQVAALADKLKPKRVRRDRVLVVTGGVFIRKLALRGWKGLVKNVSRDYSLRPSPRPTVTTCPKGTRPNLGEGTGVRAET